MSIDAGTKPSRRWWLIVILTVSLALNLFFIGAIAGSAAQMKAGGPGERFERIGARLQLNPDQQAALRQFLVTLRQRGKVTRETNLAIWKQLGDPALDQAQIPAMLDKSVPSRNAFQTALASALGQFLQGLTPEQRSAFIAGMAVENQPHGPLHTIRELLR
jgi:uncharacterized membrane protein